jgi:hypothetical protein
MIHDINKTNQFEDSSTPPSVKRQHFVLFDRQTLEMIQFATLHYLKLIDEYHECNTKKKHGKIKYPTKRNCSGFKAKLKNPDKKKAEKAAR